MTNEITIMGDAATREGAGMNGGVVMHLAPSNSATSPTLSDAVKRIAELEPNRISVATIHYQNIITQQAAIIEQQREEIASLTHDIERSQQANTSLLAEINQQREALKFYADPVTYMKTQAREPQAAINADEGRRARKALAAIDNVMKGVNWVEIKEGPMAGTFYHE